MTVSPLAIGAAGAPFAHGSAQQAEVAQGTVAHLARLELALPRV
jgi:hypothetical protein